jgi:ferredoxin
MLALDDGDIFRIASTSLRFEARTEVAALPKHTIISVAPVEKQAPAPVAEPVPESDLPEGPAVSFQHDEFPKSFSVGPDELVLAAYQQQGGEEGKPLSWDCERGACGLCLVEIVDGADNFDVIAEDAKELKVIAREGLDPDPKRYRLTCQAKITGPVTVKLAE